MAGDDPYLTINDIKAELGVSHESVRKWMLSGRLPHVRAGRMYRVRRSDLDRMLSATPPAPGDPSEPVPATVNAMGRRERFVDIGFGR
ncbi:MAG: helix-turn-helix domain-containing protein [Solirubrobacteraceae bacterium]